MEYASIPVVLALCYLAGEICKLLFSKKEELNRLIPLICTVLGGILGIVIFFTAPEMLPGAANVWAALEIGLVTGAGSTGANQLARQLFTKRKEEGGEDENPS